MPYSSGTYTFPSNSFTPTPVFNTVIDETAAASSWSDLATALSTCLLKDGTQTVTANIPMSTFKFTGLGNGTAVADSARVSQIQNSAFTYLTSVAGTNTVTATATPTPAAYAVGQIFTFIPAATNTAATTLNVSGLGAGAVQVGGGALVGGELIINAPVTVVVSAATPVFQIISPSVVRGTSASTFTFDGSGGTSSSVTMTWQKVGGFVTLHLPTVTAATGTGSTTFTSDTALPAAIRPATDSQEMAINSILDNTAVAAGAGLAAISTAGVLVIRRTAASTAWTNAATGGTAEGNTLTYFVGTGS